jgi:hypothetical protein
MNNVSKDVHARGQLMTRFNCAPKYHSARSKVRLADEKEIKNHASQFLCFKQATEELQYIRHSLQ